MPDASTAGPTGYLPKGKRGLLTGEDARRSVFCPATIWMAADVVWRTEGYGTCCEAWRLNRMEISAPQLKRL